MAAIHIALTFDGGFWAPAYATMRSVCLSTRRRGDLHFHLCHRTLSSEQRADLDRIGEEFGATLHYYDLDRMERFRGLAGRARYDARLSVVVYARLLFSEFLPAEIARLVYLDCDLLVRAPIERIAEADLGGKALAAVPDIHAMRTKMGRDMRQNRDLFDPADPYFNAGMLVIDMERWRRAEVPGRLEAALAEGLFQRIYYDQDLLNLIFAGDWLALDQLWNFTDPLPSHQSLNPHIVHYTGLRKPWDGRSKVAFARAYRHVMTNDLFRRYQVYRRGSAWQNPLLALKKLVSFR